MMDLTGVAFDLNRARALNAVVWFDEKHWSGGLLISKFIGMLGKGSDGAPQGHRQAMGFPLMNFKVEPRVKCCGHKQGP